MESSDLTSERKKEIKKAITLIIEAIALNQISTGAALNALVNITFNLLMCKGVTSDKLIILGEAFDTCMKEINGAAIRINEDLEESCDHD